MFEVSPGEVSVTFYTDAGIGEKDTIKDTVNNTQNQILRLFMSNPQITIKAISAEMEINERNVKKNIKALKDAGFIERIGATKGGHWVVK